MVDEGQELSLEDRERVDKVLRNRALPGVLIFDREGRLEYISNDARRMLAIINTESHISDEAARIPEEIYSLYRATRRNETLDKVESHCPNGTFCCKGEQYAIRAVDLYKVQTDECPECLMVIIDKCPLGRSLNADLEGAKKRFGLTNRELQVTKEIINGASNHDISQFLFISEHTVKDYVKRVIRKIGVKNRSSILCKIME
jgi:DNA-binding CsgD family transcriptional regulator